MDAVHVGRDRCLQIIVDHKRHAGSEHCRFERARGCDAVTGRRSLVAQLNEAHASAQGGGHGLDQSRARTEGRIGDKVEAQALGT